MKVLGIDPGLAETGIGIVHGRGLRVDGFAFGCIATSAKNEQAQRLETIYNKLLDVLHREAPDLMVVEDIFSLDKYPQSGILLGKVTGVILLAGFHIKVPTQEIPVREAKKVLTGNGNASKRQLEKAVRHALKLEKPIRPFHASDALGLALIGLFRQKT
ncbi:MAG: crossover junction endodeoxyribonuclease RuvC [Desulfobacterales bacterium]|jgi:crossover junction endodeoxyribonuclease RuvC